MLTGAILARLSRAILALAALMLFAAAPADATWRRAESPHFIVYGESSEARLRQQALLLEDFDRLLRLITGTTAPAGRTKLPIYFVGGNDDLRLIRPVGPSVAGFYTATPGGIAAFVDARGSDDNQLLFHEYAHHFMLQYAPGAYPAWYVEGFAEYFQTARFGARRTEFGLASEMRATWIVNGDWLSMDQFLFGEDEAALEAGQYYAQSWLTVHYFFSSGERQAALGRFLSAIARGTEPREALRAATGLTPDGLGRALRAYVADGHVPYRHMPRTAEAPPPVAATALPASADDLLLYRAALEIAGPQQNGAALLQRVRTLAARHGDDPFARRVLAHAELLFGDVAIADRLLDVLLAAAPGDAELMYLKGLRYLAAAERGGDWETNAANARRWLVRANRADADHFPTLFRFAQSMRGQPDFVSENTSNVLLLAHQLAPQVATITLTAAQMLLQRGEFARAEQMLAPLVASPHDSQVAQLVQRLLTQARARSRSDASANPAQPDEPEPPR